MRIQFSLRARRALVSVAILLLLWSAPTMPHSAPTGSLASRLLGPIANLAASVEWVRFELALLDGEPEVAYAHAERALALDPVSEEGWMLLAQHLAFERASAAFESDRDRRRAWIEEGLAVLTRGRTRVRHPADLEFLRGVVLTHVGRLVEEGSEGPNWPGAAPAAYRAAAEAFDRAAREGLPQAAEQAAGLRRRLEE